MTPPIVCLFAEIRGTWIDYPYARDVNPSIHPHIRHALQQLHPQARIIDGGDWQDIKRNIDQVTHVYILGESGYVDTMLYRRARKWCPLHADFAALDVNGTGRDRLGLVLNLSQCGYPPYVEPLPAVHIYLPIVGPNWSRDTDADAFLDRVSARVDLSRYDILGVRQGGKLGDYQQYIRVEVRDKSTGETLAIRRKGTETYIDGPLTITLPGNNDPWLSKPPKKERGSHG